MEAYVDLSEEGMVASLWTPVQVDKSSVLLHAPIEFELEKRLYDSAPVKLSAKALLEKLHLKYSQRTWTDTYKLVRYCLDRPAAGTIRAFAEHPILRSANILQEAIKAKSLSTLLTRIESISKHKGLESHLGPNGRICYITSEMFYIEVQVKRNGHVAIVKLAHCGESPKICSELLLLLRNKDFEGFGKSLEGLLHLYNIPGNSDVKAKVYRALCSLEEDMRALFNLSRLTNEDRRTTILHGKVGVLSPRSGGTPMNIEYYIAPSRVMEENPGIHVVGSNVSVTVAGTTNCYPLPVAPLFKEIPQEGGSTHEFSSLTEESSMELPACFFLRFDHPKPVLLSLIQKIQNITGLAVISTREGPLHELLILTRHKCLTDVIQQEIQFVVSLSDANKHCYVMNSQLENENAMIGVLVNKIPFIHPSHVPSILEVLRHQAAYNTLLNSCISNIISPRDSTSMLHFEVSLQSEYKICISFQHPNGDSLSCVIVDVLSCRTLTCSVYTSPSDPPSPYSNEFIMNDLQRCMSIPLTMRTIFKKAREAKVSEDVEMQHAEGNSVLPPVCSEDPKEAEVEQPSVPQDAQPTCEEKIPQNDVSNHTEDIFPDPGDGDVHSADVLESSPCQSQEPSSSYTEDPSFCTEEINSSGVDEHNSSVPAESSGLVEESSANIVQEELSPIMAEVSSSITAEEQSSSNTEELSSSVIEELTLSMIENTPKESND